MSDSDGVLSDESGALIIKPCTAREVAFYESIVAHPSLVPWVPTFLGTLKLSDTVPEADPTAVPASNRNTSIVLSNSTYGFQKPCVLDIKLGAQLWDSDAPQDKRDRLDAVSNKTTSRSLGMRVAGMRVWKKEGSYKVYDKLYGRTFTAENAVDQLKEYLDSDITTAQAILLAKRFRDKVAVIRAILEAEESRMYSASLLFVYEGDSAALDVALAEEADNAKKPAKTQEEEDEEEEEEEAKKVKKVEDLKLIDFAHATWTPGEGPDENMLQGIRSVEKLLAVVVGN